MCHNEGGASQVYSQCISVHGTNIYFINARYNNVLDLNNTIV